MPRHIQTNTAVADSPHLMVLTKINFSAQLQAYMRKMAEKYDFVNTVSIGRSNESRDMQVIQITKGGEGAPNVFIEAGMRFIFLC